MGEEGVARGSREADLDEGVVDAEASGPEQHGALEQRRRDGAHGGRGEGAGGGGAPRRGARADGGGEEGRLRRRRAEGERAGDGGGGVEEVGEHGDWRAEMRLSVVRSCVHSVLCLC